MPHKHPYMRFFEVTLHSEFDTNKYTIAHRTQDDDGFFVSLVLHERSGFDTPEEAEEAARRFIHKYCEKMDEIEKRSESS